MPTYAGNALSVFDRVTCTSAGYTLLKEKDLVLVEIAKN